MNNGLDKQRLIDRARLDEGDYFQSLLEHAHDKGMLSGSDIERMQYECLSLLSAITDRYNSGFSSSIRIETAQSMMASILFTIGLWLKTYPNPDDGVYALQSAPIAELYQKGRKRINIMLSATKTIHGKLLHQLVDIPNIFHRATLEDGIPGFFKRYYPDYAAQEHHITADYPLYNSTPKVTGIEFIAAYVQGAYYENEFLRNFSLADIHHLLSGFAANYQKLLINLYEPVLTAALGCVLAGTDPRRLDVSKAGARFLLECFSGQSKGEIPAILGKACDELSCRFEIRQGLNGYLQNSLPLIAEKIQIAAQEHMLEHVFVTPAFVKNDRKIFFSYGEKMEDEECRKVIGEIMQCRFSQDKIAMIEEHIHSLADLEDVLLDAELTKKEVQDVLERLDLMEIAALSKKYHLTRDIDEGVLRTSELLLRKCLQRHILALPSAQQTLIAQASNAMQDEDDDEI